MSRAEYIRQGLTDPAVRSAYTANLAMYALFAVLGIAVTLRRLVARAR